MRLRAHQRNQVVSGLFAGPSGRYGAAGPRRPVGSGRTRRCIRLGALLMLMGLMRLARGVRLRWRPLLAGAALTAAGVTLRGGLWSLMALPGLWFLSYALLIPVDVDRERRSALERELAAYSTPAQRRDLAATFDRYPESVTRELRDVLASQAMAACDRNIPGAGRY